jgi:hypothetical protein
MKIENALLLLWSMFWTAFVTLLMLLGLSQAIHIEYSSSPNVNLNVYINGELQGNGYGVSTIQTHSWMEEPGLCYDGIQKLIQYYPEAKIAYNPTPKQGHVWIITKEGQPIDTYYGKQNGYYWKHPTFLLNNLTELDMKIKELTGVKL